MDQLKSGGPLQWAVAAERGLWPPLRYAVFLEHDVSWRHHVWNQSGRRMFLPHRAVPRVPFGFPHPARRRPAFQLLNFGVSRVSESGTAVCVEAASCASPGGSSQKPHACPCGSLLSLCHCRAVTAAHVQWLVARRRWGRVRGCTARLHSTLTAPAGELLLLPAAARSPRSCPLWVPVLGPCSHDTGSPVLGLCSHHTGSPVLGPCSGPFRVLAEHRLCCRYP